MINRLLAILACSVVMLGLGSRASAAILSSKTDAGSALLAPARGNDSSRGSWLWSFLNPWASHLSGARDSDDTCQGVFGLGEAATGVVCGCARSSSEDSSNAGWHTFLDLGLLFLVGIADFSGSTHTSTSSSAPPSDSAPQAGLPVKVEVLCFKTATSLVAEGNFINVRDYVSSLFRPPRAI